MLEGCHLGGPCWGNGSVRNSDASQPTTAPLPRQADVVRLEPGVIPRLMMCIKLRDKFHVNGIG